MTELTNRERFNSLKKKDIRVAVLEDGDNTTWAGDAFIMHLNKEEMHELVDGSGKELRNWSFDGRGVFYASTMLEAILGINKVLSESVTHPRALAMIAGVLNECGLLNLKSP